MSLFDRKPAQQKPARVLVASGRRVDLTAKSTGPTSKHRTRPWQDDAWAYRDSIGEIRYAMGFLKYACSKVRLTLAVTSAEGEDPVPLDDATDIPAEAKAAAKDALARLSNGTFQYGDMLSAYAENLEVAGECYLVGRLVKGAEEWGIFSIDELREEGDVWKIVSGPTDRDGETLDPDTSFVARLWTPHPRWRRQPDSPMRALLETCEELQLVASMIRRASRSRIASAGILGMPTEIDFSGGPEDGDDVDGDPFQAALQRALLASIADETDPAALAPVVVRAPGEQIANIKWIQLSGDVDEKLLTRADKALTRIGTGLNVPPEIITGVADVNHWSAWQIDDNTFENHVEPLVIRMVDGFTAGYLWPVLTTEAYGVAPDVAARIIVWFDPSDLVVKPNRGEDAKAGHSANVLSDKTLVESLGFDPDQDMPDEEELGRRLARERGSIDPALAEVLIRYLALPKLPDVVRPDKGGGTISEEDGGDQGDTGDGEGPPAAETASAAPESAPGPVLRAYPRDSHRLTDIDRTLRDQVVAGADAALSRALERATNRVRTQANRDAQARAVVASVTARQLPGQLGRTVVAALGLDDETLLAGAWDHLAEQWAGWVATARGGALAAAARIAGVDSNDPALALLAPQLQQHSSDALTWLLGALDTYATDLLYDPTLDDQAVAEQATGEDPGRLGRLTTMARAATALAGGLPTTSAGVTADGVPADPGTRLGGLATGDVVDNFLRSAGTEVIGYEWVYGISLRHFAPHYALDGITFAQFGDPVLNNPEGWPASTCAPGDHRGCHCDAAPIYADGLNTAHALATVGDATYDPSYLNVLRSIAADDQAAGRNDTSAVRTVEQADRVANARPSGRK